EKEKRAEQLGARSEERGRGRQVRFGLLSSKPAPLQRLAWKKGYGGGPVTPFRLFFFCLTRCVLNHQCSLVRKLNIIKKNVLNRLGGMTKKQFVALANSIREHNRLAKFNGENAFTLDQLAALARFCASENPRFTSATVCAGPNNWHEMGKSKRC